ncbi:hypothetical protein RRG08_021239 [Elysia crispata]|uniref:Fucosyltransferase n=1 Tax=Elysia crispata TaxID=231223 RepID=A0AAE0YYA6_9GAST|nr:hypothetical protein RRG08_021239 [Elysia crispata]
MQVGQHGVETNMKEMQKYIDIDIYGKCGQPCEVFDEICVPNFVNTYRFYLSFENSFCTDYITEKFFKLYIDGSHILPVVRGGVDYNKEFPEKAFVNAADFKNPKELALFLKSLAQDDLAYSQYLEVKDRYRGITYEDRFCQMCEYLHKNEGKTRILPDAKKWYGDGHCWNPKDI